MNEANRSFPHIELKFATQGTAASPPGGGRQKTPTTQSNLGDRWGHGNKLKGSVAGIVSDWQEHLVERQQEEKPELPKAIPVILRIDPTAFEAEQLRGFGIEVIAELEDGYIIGASADINLTKLQEKIGKFINAENRSGKVSEIYDFIDKVKRPEYILSPELQAQWGQIEDEQIYTVDIGIACLGEKSQLKDHPKSEEKYKSSENYFKAVNEVTSQKPLVEEKQ
jgi:hypothetical protein